MGKISGVLEYLEALDASADDELVLMIDAYGTSGRKRDKVTTYLIGCRHVVPTPT